MAGRLHITPLSEWSISIPGKPVLIAGPCSAESREQLMDAAKSLKDCGVSVLRAGIWKPRTRPGCFEGLGEDGLDCLVEAGHGNGMKVATEVGMPSHVEACLRKGVDILWIGARTSANPFAMQELADALHGVDAPVLVKNPVSPDPSLWAGAIERLYLAGVRKIAAVTRGFSTLDHIRYANDPRWDVVVSLRGAFPGLPVFCDPSHMAGATGLVGEIAQKAFDLGLDGLMVEVHPSPSCALSDASQQLTPAQFAEMISTLKVRESGSDDADYNDLLTVCRSRIDELDSELLRTLAARMEESRKIGEAKLRHGIAIIQPPRWDEVMKNVLSRGEALGLDRAFVEKIFAAVHEASVNEQNSIDK